MDEDIGKNDCHELIILKQGEGSMEVIILFCLKFSIIINKKRRRNSYIKGHRYNITILRFSLRNCDRLVCLYVLDNGSRRMAKRHIFCHVILH